MYFLVYWKIQKIFEVLEFWLFDYMINGVAKQRTPCVKNTNWQNEPMILMNIFGTSPKTGLLLFSPFFNVDE